VLVLPSFLNYPLPTMVSELATVLVILIEPFLFCSRCFCSSFV